MTFRPFLCAIAFCLLASTFAEKTVKCPSDAIKGFTDKGTAPCYLFETYGVQYVTAEERCRSVGGHLASIDNAFVDDFIAQAGEEVLGISKVKNFWIGASDLLSSKQFAWIDGSPLNYTNWAKHQPNVRGKRQCVAIKLSNGEWETASCFKRKSYVCEISQSAAATITPTEETVTNWPTAASTDVPSAESSTLGDGGLTTEQTTALPSTETVSTEATFAPTEEPTQATEDFSTPAATVEPSTTSEPTTVSLEVSTAEDSTIPPVTTTLPTTVAITTEQVPTTVLTSESITTKATYAPTEGTTQAAEDPSTQAESTSVTTLATPTIVPTTFEPITTAASTVEAGTSAKPSTNIPEHPSTAEVSTVRPETNQPSTSAAATTEKIPTTVRTSEATSSTSLPTEQPSTTTTLLTTATPKDEQTTTKQQAGGGGHPPHGENPTEGTTGFPTTHGESTASSTTNVPTTSPSRVTCPDKTWKVYKRTNACYKLINSPPDGATWEQQRQICTAANSDLVSIHSASENWFVSNLIKSNEKEMVASIGLHSADNEYAWSDDTPVNYINWDSTAANDGGCVVLSVQSTGSGGKWKSQNCDDAQFAFVCKYALAGRMTASPTTTSATDSPTTTISTTTTEVPSTSTAAVTTTMQSPTETSTTTASSTTTTTTESPTTPTASPTTTAKATTTSSPKSTVFPATICGGTAWTYSAQTQLCYRMYSSPTGYTWSGQRKQCQTDSGGDLVSIHSALENSVVSGLVIDVEEELISIGLSSTDDEPYQWSDGTSVNYENWLGGKPSTENACVFLSTLDNKWQTIDCNELQYTFVCKKSPLW